MNIKYSFTQCRLFKKLFFIQTFSLMVNQCGYEKCEEIEVDEKREIYDLSDHCMVRLRLKIKKNKQKKEKEETIEKYRLSQGRMNNYKKRSEG